MATPSPTAFAGWHGASWDAYDALMLARRLCPQGGALILLHQLRVKTVALLDDAGVWRSVEAIAEALLEQGTLTGRECRRLFVEAREAVAYQERLEAEVFGG